MTLKNVIVINRLKTYFIFQKAVVKEKPQRQEALLKAWCYSAFSFDLEQA